MEDNEEFGIKYQVFSNLCVSNLEFKHPLELKEATELMYNYLTENMIKENKPSATLHTVN
jgi:hypothetical protein